MNRKMLFYMHDIDTAFHHYAYAYELWQKSFVKISDHIWDNEMAFDL